MAHPHTANARRSGSTRRSRAFREIAASYEQLGELANVLATTPFTDRQMKATVDEVMPVPQDDRDHVRLVTEREKVLNLFETGAVGIERLRGTAWAALQAWTEFADHHGRSRHEPRRSAPRPAGVASGWVARR